MDRARFAALFAVILGAFAMVVNFLALPMLFNKVATIQIQMQARMENFKNVADQAWTEMMVLRNIYAARMTREALQDFDTAAVPFPYGYNPPSDGKVGLDVKNTTQAAIAITTAANPVLTTTTFASSSANADNYPCPPGPPGPAGEVGQDGLPGAPGAEGLQGKNASEIKLFDEEMCTRCPHGPPGPVGLQGPRGVPGKPGKKGEVGKKGLDGETGKLGHAGFQGISGIPGKNGTKGVAGKPAPGGKGDKGPRGARGPIGRAGPQGETGKPNLTNLGPGLVGIPGKNGENGTSGKTGAKGATGPPGFVGMEGGYCPCPKELRKLGLPDNTTTIAPDDSKQTQTQTLLPVGSPPSVQPPSAGSLPVAAPVGLPVVQQGPNLLDSPPSNTLNIPNDHPPKNNLVQLP